MDIGIGFVTGRKNFKNVLRAYLNNWNEYSPLNRESYVLHLFVAYDLDYSGTEVDDYTIVEKDILEAVDSLLYINSALIDNETKTLVEKKITGEEEWAASFRRRLCYEAKCSVVFRIEREDGLPDFS